MKTFNKLLFLLISIMLISPGCDRHQSNLGHEYYVVFIEGKENLIKKVDQYVSFEDPVLKIDYFVNVQLAQNRFPGYQLDKGPIIMVFEEKKRRLLLKTNDVEHGLNFLENLIEKESGSLDS